MTDDDRIFDAHRVDDVHDILRQASETVAGGRRGGASMPTSGDCQDAVARSEHRRKVIKGVPGVAESREEDEGWTGASPVQHFQPYAVRDRDELRRVRRRILP